MVFLCQEPQTCYGSSFLKNFRKRRGKESHANVEFEMLFAQRSHMEPACYLNISGPVLKGFKDAL